MRHRRFKRIRPALTTLPPLDQAGKGRHPHLSDEQRRRRRDTAVHEAAHFAVGVLLVGTTFQNVVIRVPGRTPRGAICTPGAAGTAHVNGATDREEALIHAVGSFVECVLRPGSWQQTAKHDLQSFADIAQRAEFTVEYQTSLLDEAFSLFFDHWQAIEGVAAGFLHLCSGSGVVDHADCRRLADWVRAKSWSSRAVTIDLPSAFRRKRYEVNTMQYLKGLGAAPGA